MMCKTKKKTSKKNMDNGSYFDIDLKDFAVPIESSSDD